MLLRYFNSASEVTTIWRYTNVYIIIIIIIIIINLLNIQCMRIYVDNQYRFGCIHAAHIT